MAKFALVGAITVIYHTIPFIWAITLTHANRHHFFNTLLVMKMVTVGDLCLTYVILFILIYVLGPLVCRQPFNDPCLVHCVLYLIKMMGE